MRRERRPHHDGNAGVAPEPPCAHRSHDGQLGGRGSGGLRRSPAAGICRVRVRTMQWWVHTGMIRWRDPAVALADAVGLPAARLMGFAIRFPLGHRPRQRGDLDGLEVCRATRARRGGFRISRSARRESEVLPILLAFPR
jgi:hypothetical protein